MLLAAACEPPFRPPAVVATVAIAPDSLEVRWGATRSLTATVRDSSGAELRGVTVTWTSSQPHHIAISQDGTVRALQPGRTTITARARDATGSATVVAFAPVKAVALPVPDYRLVPGATLPLTAALTDSLGGPLFGRPATWSSSDTTVFAIDGAGVLTARATGSARVIVASDDGADSAEVRVVPARFVAIRPGLGAHTCALADDGRTFCWGANHLGQLGVGETTAALGPVGVAGDHRFADVRGGGQFHCAVASDGTVRCWGNGARGRLGNGSLANSAVPVQVAGNSVYRAVAAGWSHACALAGPAGTLCWGGNTAMVPEPFALPDSIGFVHLMAGDNFSCALEAGGQAWCWGHNGAGQVGDGSNEPRAAPMRVAGDLAFVALSSGASHSCGLTAAGLAWCWGRNDAGQLGDGSTAARNTPVLVSGGLVFRAVSAGVSHSCGLTTGGEAWCWGANHSGQLGDGTTIPTPAPVRAAAGLQFTSLAAGGSHTCGIAADARAWCWGANQAGQLGDGTKTDRSTPTRVSGQP